MKIIDLEVKKLLDKGVILQAEPERRQFVSSVFTRPKKDGSKRMILNLKKLNKFFTRNKFKMESLNHVLDALVPNCFMASVDLKDAYFSIPIYAGHTRYLKFSHRDKLFKFVAMPNGYGPAMRAFTKVTKVPFTSLRQKGHISVVYVDDTYLQRDTYQTCMKNVIDTINMLRSLGFTIHAEKSVFPQQEITFLGFVLNSIDMSITLTLEKKQKNFELCADVLSGESHLIRYIAKVIGNLIASLPAVPFGKLFYRVLEKEKTKALKVNRGDFDRYMSLSSAARDELFWWKENILTAVRFVRIPQVDLIIHTDASKIGWGITNGVVSSGGQWDQVEMDMHINFLELKAIEFGVKTFGLSKAHVQVKCDNTTAISYINEMGGMQSQVCNNLAKEIWLWCKSRDIWISAAFIPGKENKVADECSRVFNESIEWMLNPSIFSVIVDTWYCPDIDLFATRLNKQIERYISWRPDPFAEKIDAFSCTWNPESYYIFPPFSIISKVICKIQQDGTRGILVLPDWPSQHWYPRAMKLAKGVRKFPPDQCNLLLPQARGKYHPLRHKLWIMALRFLQSYQR